MGQKLYLKLISSCGLIPLADNAKRIFLDSELKFGHFKSTNFQVGESAGCHNFPSTTCSLACQIKFLAFSILQNNLLKRGINGTYHTIFLGICFFFFVCIISILPS